MDPLSLAVQHFHQALRPLLAPPAPGFEPPAAAHRLVVEGTSPGELFKALRLFEYQDDNRHPFVIFTDPVTDEASFLRAALAQLTGDERSIREGLAEAGAPIPQVAIDPLARTASALASELDRLASAVAQVLDGIVVALIPTRVHDQAAYRRIVQALSERARFPDLVLLARHSPHHDLGQLLPSEVALRVDRKALADFVKNLKSPHDVGPPREGAPQLTPKQHKELEQRLGRRLATKSTGQELKNLLFEAATFQSEGKFELAAKRFRMARTLCFVSGLKQEQAICALAVGTAHFSCGRHDRALEAYREGLTLARELRAPRLCMQAELGIALTHYTRKEHPLAREAYARVHALAGELAPMRLEALRMTGECFLEERRPADAVATFTQALDEAEALDPPVRASTAFRQVGARLRDTLQWIGRPQDLPALMDRLARLESDPNAPRPAPPVPS